MPKAKLKEKNRKSPYRIQNKIKLKEKEYNLRSCKIVLTRVKHRKAEENKRKHQLFIEEINRLNLIEIDEPEYEREIDRLNQIEIEEIFQEIVDRVFEVQQQQAQQDHVHNNRRSKIMSEFVKKVDDLCLEGNIAENWRRFKRDFDIFLIASEQDTGDDRIKIAKFLNAIGYEAREVYESFNLTAAQKAVYTEVVKSFETFCEPKKNPVYERFLFYQRSQKEGETFDAFLMDIRRLIRTCEFQAIESEMLRDRIVMGVSNKKLQAKLLETSDLTYETAVQKARANEATQEQTSHMNRNVNAITHNGKYGKNNNNNKGNKNHVQTDSNSKKSNANKNMNSINHKNNNNFKKFSNNSSYSNEKLIDKCRFCNFSHKIKNCPAYGKNCASCNKMNHFASVCRYKGRNIQEIASNNVTNTKNNTEIEDNNALYISSIEKIVGSVNKTTVLNWNEALNINGHEIKVKIDTGSEVNIISRTLLNKIYPKSVINSSSIVLRGFGGNEIHPQGTCRLECVYYNIIRKVEFVIVDFETSSLLGLQSCIDFGLVNLSDEHRISRFANKIFF